MDINKSHDSKAEDVEQHLGPILHVLVVGFHHKKGCQVEYSYPPLVSGAPNDSTECPPPWKYLPTLALPDGSHNYEEDTVYFHLPSLTNPKQTIFGVSCFRQIEAEKLVNKTADITRSTVQKSVCVLSNIPLYGHIQVKMSLITHAYFKEGDFSKVMLLQETYANLNNCLNQIMLKTPEVFVGLSLREFILQFRHKVLLLFKLVLLEKRVLFFKSPVWQLCATVLSLLSTFPGMIESGLAESACVKPSRPMSPVPHFSTDSEEGNKIQLSPTKSSALDEKEASIKLMSCDDNQLKDNKQADEREKFTIEDGSKANINHTTDESVVQSKVGESESKEDMHGSRSSLSSNGSVKVPMPTSESLSNITSKVTAFKGRLSGALNYWSGREAVNQTSPEKEIASNNSQFNNAESEKLDEEVNFEKERLLPNINAVMQMKMEDCALPLCIFTKGYLCHPYLSLPYLDLLSDIEVRGYVIGATNVLFKQKKNVADVIVEIDGAKVEIQGNDLKRQLHLTTEDLRFADYLVKHVSEERHDVFLDGVGWEGGDEWIRIQFKLYLLSLLRTSMLQEGSRELEHFNSSFVSVWKTTHNYKMWAASNNLGILEVNPGHPFAGQLSMADMKLRLSHTMQTTEGGRKLNQAVASTGRAVAQTSKAVGGALSQARGALSSWWSTFTPPPQNTEADSTFCNSPLREGAIEEGVEIEVLAQDESTDDKPEKDSDEYSHRDLSWQLINYNVKVIEPKE